MNIAQNVTQRLRQPLLGRFTVTLIVEEGVLDGQHSGRLGRVRIGKLAVFINT
jgi:hypothetical protein